MSWEHVTAARGVAPDAPAQSVLALLATYADEAGCAWPSVATIERDTKLARSTVQAALRRLQSAALLTLITPAIGQRAAVYRLTLTRPAVIPARETDLPASHTGRGPAPVRRGPADESDPPGSRAQSSLNPHEPQKDAGARTRESAAPARPDMWVDDHGRTYATPSGRPPVNGSGLRRVPSGPPPMTEAQRLLEVERTRRAAAALAEHLAAKPRTPPDVAISAHPPPPPKSG